MIERWLDDYVPGAVHELGTFSVSEAEIIDFARQFDPQPIHVDPDFAARGPFGGLIASGNRRFVEMVGELATGQQTQASAAGPLGFKVYYLRYNGQMYIKRLVDAGGQLGIASDGDANILLVSDADDFEIIGRCIWTARELD